MIGLLSFHRAINYGAILQSYALHEAINTLGYENEYLDLMFNDSSYKSDKPKKRDIILKLMNINKVKSALRIRIKEKKFNEFRKNYIRTSSKVYSGDRNIVDEDIYDNYIVGSDQVWNLRISNYTKSFLLDFVNEKKKKSSYASSFGIEQIPDDQRKEFSENLKRFNNISVREEVGAGIIEEIIGHRPTVCLDPTLLLNSNNWLSVTEKPKIKNYVFIYSMVDSENIINIAKQIAKEKNLSIVAIGLKNRYKNIKNIYTASPQQWLGYVKYADYVVTNSFHGTAFSVNFNKKFYLEFLPLGWTVNSRLQNIVDLFGLEKRVITKNKLLEDNVDYDFVNSKLEKERKKSWDYLRRICV